MSRSYKKHAWACDRNPFIKSFANRRLRRLDPMKDVAASGKWYRKVTNPWYICDWKWAFGDTFHEYIRLEEYFLGRTVTKQERKALYRQYRKQLAK